MGKGSQEVRAGRDGPGRRCAGWLLRGRWSHGQKPRPAGPAIEGHPGGSGSRSPGRGACRIQTVAAFHRCAGGRATAVCSQPDHATTGTVRIVEQPDGKRLLTLENLDTSNGSDVHVWLSAAKVVEGTAGWFTAGSAEYYDLGLIKGNQGNQVYDIPADVDLARYKSVDLWCVQFSVSFGAADLVI